MNFKHYPVYNQSEDFNRIINHEAISYFLKECNAYIAGGCAEKEHNSKSLKKYLKREYYDYPGDIDIYFTTIAGFEKAKQYCLEYAHIKPTSNDDSVVFDVDHYERFIATMQYNLGKYSKTTYDRFKHIRCFEKSSTEISWQAWIDLYFPGILERNDRPVKIQLIGKDFIGPIEEILNTFDFSNVQIAYYIKGDKLFCCKSDIEHNNNINIVNTDSPLMMHRLNKYLLHKGYKSVTESSKEKIVEWLIKARAGHFRNPVLGITLWEDALNCNVIKRAISEKIIPDDALPLIIGKVITEKQVYRSYRRYETIRIDEALEAIKERKENVNN